jgi:NAD(P)-dependent dehydrogenase (short-subunit alcohol dehydrogenase family)
VAVAAANPRRITAVILDVTNDEHIAGLVAALPVRLDGIVNNAGIAVSGPIETVSTEDWRKQLEVNVIGQLAVTRAVLPGCGVARQDRVHLERERQARDADGRRVQRVEVRARGRRRRAADGTRTVAHRGFAGGTRADRHRHVAHGRHHGHRDRGRADARAPRAAMPGTSTA